MTLSPRRELVHVPDRERQFFSPEIDAFRSFDFENAPRDRFLELNDGEGADRMPVHARRVRIDFRLTLEEIFPQYEVFGNFVLRGRSLRYNDAFYGLMRGIGLENHFLNHVMEDAGRYSAVFEVGGDCLVGQKGSAGDWRIKTRDGGHGLGAKR